LRIELEGDPALHCCADLKAQLVASDRMAVLGTMAAGIAHEINNPMVAVLGNLECALACFEEPGRVPLTTADLDLKEALLDAMEGARRVREIVRDLRIFARNEADDCGPVDVHGVLESVVRLGVNEIRHRARLVRDYAEIPPVHAVESRLGQVFLNLLINAAQALSDGHAESNEIKLRTRLDGAFVVVEVSDTGTGIAPHVMERLFTPFVTTKPKGVGTGLGLAICRDIVHGFGGEISASTELGRGTTFRVRLPVSSSRRSVAVEATRAPLCSPRRGRVLVLDDDPVVLSTIKRALSREHDVTVHADPRQALGELARSDQFDLVLCDLMMPVMGGREFLESAVRLAPQIAHKTVFLTGGAFTPEARQFLEENRNRCLPKPFDLHLLRELAAEAVSD
jgi:CheY-like chemotaxis protein